MFFPKIAILKSDQMRSKNPHDSVHLTANISTLKVANDNASVYEFMYIIIISLVCD